MKIRTGFVSNSSSASFVLNKQYLTGDQIERILNYSDGDGWNIYDNGDHICGYTNMDNGYFCKFLKGLNIGLKAIKEWNDMS